MGGDIRNELMHITAIHPLEMGRAETNRVGHQEGGNRSVIV